MIGSREWARAAGGILRFVTNQTFDSDTTSLASEVARGRLENGRR